MSEGGPEPAGPLAGRLTLVGLRGAGKSSLGRVLADRLAVPFLDLDLEISRRYAAAGESTGAFLDRAGLQRFRQCEAEALAACLASPGPLVLATGGGVVESAANRELLSSSSTCIWLRASAEELLRRTTADGTLRPALTHLSPDEERLLLAARRQEHYASVAELRLETEGRGLDSLADEIFCHLSR